MANQISTLTVELSFILYSFLSSPIDPLGPFHTGIPSVHFSSIYWQMRNSNSVFMDKQIMIHLHPCLFSLIYFLNRTANFQICWNRTDVNRCRLFTTAMFMFVFRQETFLVYTAVTSDWLLRQLRHFSHRADSGSAGDHLHPPVHRGEWTV